MITRNRIISLEKRFLNNTRLNDGGIVIRSITQDGRLLDKDNYLLTSAEVKKIEKDNLKIKERGCTIVNLVSYEVSKVKPSSSIPTQI